MSDIKFGTDGWRGVIADTFTFTNVSIASQAIGKFILNTTSNKDFPVLIGHDTRFLADKFAKTCALELINLGLNVKLSKSAIPTPVIAFTAAKLKSNGAIQFTASHNPPEYCGLKYITNYGGPAPQETTDEITKLIRTHKFPSKKNLSSKIEISTFDPKEDYVSHLKNLIDFEQIKNAGLKIVYDPIFGAGNNYLDYILKIAGCNTTTIHNKKDSLFGGLLPEPREEYLKDLKENVKHLNANIGLATDGDADRLGAIDKDGMFFSPNKIASMLLRHLVKNKKLKGAVVRTLSTTHLIDYLAKSYGLEVIETQVGFKWICEEMRKKDVLIGIEESGGISILNHIPDKDAILAGLLLTEMLAFEKKSLSEIFSDTIKDAKWFCINDKLDLHINDKQKNFLISKLQLKEIKQIGGLNVKSVNTIEGAKYLLKDGSWFLARASGTEPIARVYFEATSDKILEAMKSTVQKFIKDTLACQK